jgi:hypothetical protein
MALKAKRAGVCNLKITFILRNGATIDSIIPEDQRKDFNFMLMCGVMRNNGFFQSGNMHLQYAEISGMLLDTDDAVAPEFKPPTRKETLQ